MQKQSFVIVVIVVITLFRLMIAPLYCRGEGSLIVEKIFFGNLLPFALSGGGGRCWTIDYKANKGSHPERKVQFF